MKNDIDRRGLIDLDPDLLQFVGLGSKPFNKLRERINHNRLVGPSRKIHAFQYSKERPKRNFTLEEFTKDQGSPIHVGLENIETSNDIENQLVNLCLTLNFEEDSHQDEVRPNRSQWSWKKEARRQFQGVQACQMEMGETSRQDASFRRHLDFH